MKYNNTTLAIFYLLTCTCSTNVFADEYKTKSVFSADYKCISETKGGFNHSASGHDLTRFQSEEEFFLTHISNIPDEAIVGLNQVLKSNTDDVNVMRAIFESFIMKQEITTGNRVVEESSYFIREPEIDPKKISTYYLNGCTVYKSPKWEQINCYQDDDSKSFVLDLETMRFTYSYAGTWHKKRENDYYGDSSVFVFGTCKEYYR